MTPILRLLTATAAALLCLITATPAVASAGQIDGSAATYLKSHPGGTLINSNEVSYANGAFIVTVDPPHTLAAADCPTGWFCFYEFPNFGYPRGKLSSCGRQSLATYQWAFRVESAHYNMSRGYVDFQLYDTVLFRVGVANRVVANAYPYHNAATHVYRRSCNA